VRSFLGLANYYRRFVPHFSNISDPLQQLTRDKVDFIWGEQHNKVFEELRLAISSCITLQLFHPKWRFQLTTDASNVGLGAKLSQIDEGGREHSLAFASRSLTDAERNLATVEKECLAIVWAVSKWRHYLLCREFDILCDHKPLQWLKSVKDQNSKLMRWSLKLGEYNFQVIHIPGPSNKVADALSRSPLTVRHIKFQGEYSDGDIKKLQEQDSELAQIRYWKRIQPLTPPSLQLKDAAST
jgi:hypothetical protein